MEISARWDRPSSARLDEADASASESRTCDIRVLLGDSEDPLAHVYASRILDGIAKCRPSDDKGMILSLALKRKPSDVEADVVGSPLWDANRSNLETVLGLLKDCGLL